MQTYILELDIIGFTPGSAFGRAAVYSACVCRSLGAPATGAAGRVVAWVALVEGLEAVRRGMVMAVCVVVLRDGATNPLLSLEIQAPAAQVTKPAGWPG